MNLLDRTDRLASFVPDVAIAAGQSPRPIPIEAKDEGSVLMMLSIRQALAGPGDGDDAAWVGKKVTDLVELIYKGHVWNLAKRIETRRRLEKEQGEMVRKYLKKPRGIAPERPKDDDTQAQAE